MQSVVVSIFVRVFAPTGNDVMVLNLTSFGAVLLNLALKHARLADAARR